MSALPSPLKSLVPMACHFDPGLARVAVARVEVPFISQICGVPSLFWNRMSDMPSPLKSPVPMACQDLPMLGSVAVAMTEVPFISQIIGVPLLLSTFWKRMSALPSALKSPAPITRQEAPGFVSAALATTEVPFITQIIGVPFVFCHRMSGLPSPLKSSPAITCQDDPGFASVTVLVALVPFINQICGVPSLLCRTMSVLPSWLKSPMASTCHPLGVVIVPEDATEEPLSNSTSRSGWFDELFWNNRSESLSPSKSLRTEPLIEIVVVAVVLRLFEPLPSLTTQVTVRVRLVLPLLGLLPDEKVTESSTD